MNQQEPKFGLLLTRENLKNAMLGLQDMLDSRGEHNT